MDEKKWLADEFEANRAHLRAAAYRMLGSRSEAEDAVQEAWLRLSRADTSDVGNLGGWLTTVVARICLDMLRARKTRREEPLEIPVHGAIADPANDPERDAAFAESVGVALLVVLQTLAPAERVAFVLHDMFDLPFDEIASIIGRSSAATRQLASRARRRVQGVDEAPDVDFGRKQTIAQAFLTASRNGDIEALIAVLAPDVAFRPDATAARFGAVGEVRGAPAVAALFKGRAQAAEAAIVDGEVGFVVRTEGQIRVVVALTIADGKIMAIDAFADPDYLERVDYSVLSG
ncbi:RNA polymerase sigma-70 factor (ECF subfamily) [Rhizobium leguminosarum]|uniref:RNA polymerase sigma-70 factor (ECF subfamily) n=1 Tax=Rhizobium leguminosarum TaxID=384 RepID=A0AAE2MMD7_RHILE|nr:MULTISPECIES: sigma-70 family RNA polymerase sigma factor [Rhizobium]MBB4292323.1 RNA polymerase sigma-70 factor (ECF subfamily) [Rhizobium leguminosarum]MBB4299872.1 RNA polymerase sigma-70 factor (ECF subfamily) [Rhizobium leguminosarum]MBB4309739.1 RNA polymerase sigma-70 factor (ECF subfamily) [Rhizobium leguminosarum]MBB4419521.1 RNA polymerase sigma-70 factor (ECF subfamily) [Rhizobium leguminosarum]MBB4434324.1 RNA polymerase sigma-70 factor (ECF subfamily) [Rhizobium esperanzae]